MHIIKKFNRFELKYVLPLQVADDLKKSLKNYVLPDAYGDDEGKYVLSSLYYDSPQYHMYWEKVDGLKFRRKLRIRWYETEDGLSDDSQVFLEIKQRIDRVTQKKRIPMAYKEALDFCDSGVVPQVEKEDLEVIEEMESLMRLYRLKPSSITSYTRQAFVGTDYDMGLRITFDSHVTSSVRNLNMGEGSYDSFIVPPHFVIMEIKTNERIPYWVTELVAEKNLQLVRVSKYCLGLEQALQPSLIP